MNKLLILFIALMFTTGGLQAQNPFELGAEYIRTMGQGYSASKVAARAEAYSKKSSFSLGITYQLASKKSYSVSTGVGFYAGYRYAFNTNEVGSSFFAGPRIFISFENFAGKSRENSMMITPMIEAGYHFVFADRLFTTPAIGAGYTIEYSKGYNSLDEDRGFRVIPSLSAGYRFNVK
jgi:hypothetical protein